MLVVVTFKTRLQSQEQSGGICTLIPKLQTPASLEKTLILGEIGGRRQRGRQQMRWLNGITDLMDVE